MKPLEKIRESYHRKDKFNSPDTRHYRRQKLIEDYENTIEQIKRCLTEIENIDPFEGKKFDQNISEYNHMVVKADNLERSIQQEFHLINVRQLIEDFKNGVYDDPLVDEIDLMEDEIYHYLMKKTNDGRNNNLNQLNCPTGSYNYTGVLWLAGQR